MKPINPVSLRFFAFFLLIGSLLAGTAGAITIPTGLPTALNAYIPVNGVTATSSYQIYAYSTPFNAEIGNYLTFNGFSGVVCPTWGESSNSIWINTIVCSPNGMNNGILYIGLQASTSNTYFGNAIANVGEAPQLSPSYAEYDNGANVFTEYCNFASAECSWLSHTTGGGGSIAYSDGAKITNGGSAGGSFEYSTIGVNTIQNIADVFCSDCAFPDFNYYGFAVMIGTLDSGDTYPVPNAGSGYSCAVRNDLGFFLEWNGGNTGGTGGYQNFNGLITCYWSRGNQNEIFNYVSQQTASDTGETKQNAQFGFGAGEQNGGESAFTYIFPYFRIRTAPPSYTMPLITFGSPFTTSSTTSTSTTSTTSTTTTTTSTSTTSTTSTTTTIPYANTPNAGILGIVLSFFRIPLAGVLLLVLAWGLAYMFSRRYFIAFLITSLVSYLEVYIIAISFISIIIAIALTTLTMFIWIYESRQHKRQ